MAPKILFVLTSANLIKAINKPTGWYLPEMAHPYEYLVKDFEIVTASPAGGEAPLDPSSVEAFKEDKICTNYLKNSSHTYKNTAKLSDFVGKSSDFAAIFYVGGHGPMFDLATDSTSHKIINEFRAAGKVISAVCHGPAVFAFVKDPTSGEFIIKGHKITAFSNAEEDAVQLSSAMPFMLETELKKNGGLYEKAKEDWAAHVVTSGKMITGQNPASAQGVAEAIKAAITL